MDIHKTHLQDCRERFTWQEPPDDDDRETFPRYAGRMIAYTPDGVLVLVEHRYNAQHRERAEFVLGPAPQEDAA